MHTLFASNRHRFGDPAFAQVLMLGINFGLLAKSGQQPKRGELFGKQDAVRGYRHIRRQKLEALISPVAHFAGPVQRQLPSKAFRGLLI